MEKIPTTILYKIGAVSELTGIPVTTIRDWENRYQAFAPTKTSGNHRMYQQSDIERALLFKHLSEKGQSISTIAKLASSELQALLRNYRLAELTHKAGVPQTSNLEISPEGLTPAAPDLTRTVRATVIGHALSKRLEGAKFIQAFSRGKLQISQTISDLSSANSAASDLAGNASQGEPKQRNQLLIISQNTLQLDSGDVIRKLSEILQPLKVILLYQFAPGAVTEILRGNGVILKREPLTEGELAELIESVLVIDAAHFIAAPHTQDKDSTAYTPNSSLIPPRKYSDESLLKIAAVSTDIFCECPKHVSEIISHLASFEKYSQDCLSHSHDDRELHGYLSSVSGTARALFEVALEKIAAHEGLTLDP